MINFEGSLNAQTIVKVLQVLITKNPACTWLISDGENEKVVYFSTGGVRLYSSSGRRVATIEDFLVKRKLVERDMLEMAAREAQESRGESIESILERMECLPRERFIEATAELIYLELCDLVTWESAIFEFYAGNPPPEIFDQDHPALFAGLDVKALAERVREWSQDWGTLRGRLYSERLCPRLIVGESTIMEAPELSVDEKYLYRLIDGERSLRRVAQATGQDFARVARLVWGGMQSGWLTGSLIPEKVPSTPEEVLSEVEKLEEALDKAINTILIHKRIATNYERIEQNDLASSHYQSIGNIHTDNGQLPKAVESYRRAVALAPENVGAHEVLIRRLQDVGEDESALDEIVNLSKKLISFGFLQRAADQLKTVADKVATRFDVRILFADVLVKLGRVQEAIAQYLGVAEDKKRMGSLEGLDELYRKVLELDPVNREARAGISRETKRRVGSRRVWINRISAAAAVLLLAGWVAIEVSARGAWAQVQSDVEQAVSERRIGACFAALRRFGESYPGTTLANDLLPFERALFEQTFDEVERDLALAAQHRREGWVKKARDLYEQVVDTALVDAQIRRARVGLDEAEAVIEKWSSARSQAEAHVEARRFEKAFWAAREVIQNFPEGAEGMRVPFYIRTEPSKALLKVGSVPKGYSPGWVVIRYGRNQELTIEPAGYSTKVLRGFEERTTPLVHVDLRQ